MKKIIAAAAITLVTASLALAADTISLPAKNGNVTFTHKKHQELLKDCKICHAKGPGKIAELGKEWAHKTCIDCHKAKAKGPVRCSECHKK